MIPTSEQLAAIARLDEGVLGACGPAGAQDGVSFATLLLAASSQRRTVMVEVRRKQLSKRILFEHGTPIDCRSNLVHETLGRYMVAQGKLAADDLHGYLGQSASLGLPLGEVLIDRDVVTAEELYRLLQENLAKKLLDVFTWRDGHFRTHAEVPHPQSPLKIRVPQLIVTGITKFAPQEEVDAGVVPLVGKKLVLHPRPPYALEEIRLNQRQSQVAVALRSGWRIDELALGTGMPFEEITRLLYALAILGVVITAEQLAARSAMRITRPAGDAGDAESARVAPGSPGAPGAQADAAAARPDAAAPAPAGAGPSPAIASPPATATSSPPAAPAAPAAAGAAEAPTGRAVRAETSATRPMPTLQPLPPLPPLPPVSPVGEAPAPRSEPAAPAAWATPAAAAGPTAAGPTAAAGAATAEDAAVERRRNEIMQAYLSYRRLDAFDLLGTDEDSSPGAVEAKYLEFARRFAPWALGGPELAGMDDKARDLFLAGARAYAELQDLEQRNTLLFRRKARREERDRRAPADMLAIKTDLLDPEVQYRKGRALMDAGKFQEAAVLIEFASDCDPQNGLYNAELAYCRFCQAPGQGARALKELQETLRRDPDCGLAVYYAGEVHRQLGDRDDAEKMLRRAIKMMAPDRRPIEALKLLSAEKRKP